MPAESVGRSTCLPLLATLLMLACPTPAQTATAKTEIEVARGIELVNSGSHREALGPLERALAAEPHNQEALFYAGLAHSRLDEYESAGDLLERALAQDEAAEIYFELGRVRALTGRCTDAERLFARYEVLGSDETGRKAAGDLLRGCGGDRSARRLRLGITAGWQHDSNVILEPLHPTAPKPVKADERELLYLTAGAAPLKTKNLALDLGYSFYGNLHDELQDYNAVAHRVTATLALASWERVHPALGYTFEYAYFGGLSYNRAHRGSLQVELREGERAATEAVLEMRDMRFWDSGLFTDNADRTGGGESAGLRQRWTLGPVETTLALYADRDRARESWWDADGWRASAKALWRPTASLALVATGEYQARDYDAPYPGQSTAREDRTQTWSAALTWSLSRSIALTLSENWSHNAANLDFYEYTRNIVGLYATISLGR